MHRILTIIANILETLSWRIRKKIRKNDCNRHRSTLIKEGKNRSLYQTKFGDFFWLDPLGYVDKCIIETSVWEPMSSEIIKNFVKNGHVVFDIGANFGYYSVICSKLVGEKGKIFAFEPTKKFREVLLKNIENNQINNIEVIPFGLSNKNETLEICLSTDTATLHPCQQSSNRDYENIELITLDDFVSNNMITKIDFIKIDVDGHECNILMKSWETLEKYTPIVLLEVNHLSYFFAGHHAADLFTEIQQRGWKIYWENNLQKIDNLKDFLVKCANYNSSTNILISKHSLS